MKIQCSCLLILSLVILSGCVSMSGYRQASLRHRAYTSGQRHATAAEWRALISEFQTVIDINTARSQQQMMHNMRSLPAGFGVIKTGDTEALLPSD